MELTPFEIRVMRMIEKDLQLAGNKCVALVACARRLERKGLAMKGTRWWLTEAGKKRLEEQTRGEANV